MRCLLSWLVSLISLGVTLGLLGLAGVVVADPYPRFEIGDAGTALSIIETNVAAVTAAIGVLIALVLLTVQFTAQRYSYDVIRIFIQSWVNAEIGRHTSELQSRQYLVCRLLLEKKKK